MFNGFAIRNSLIERGRNSIRRLNDALEDNLHKFRNDRVKNIKFFARVWLLICFERIDTIYIHERPFIRCKSIEIYLFDQLQNLQKNQIRNTMIGKQQYISDSVVYC